MFIAGLFLGRNENSAGSTAAAGFPVSFAMKGDPSKSDFGIQNKNHRERSSSFGIPAKSQMELPTTKAVLNSDGNAALLEDGGKQKVGVVGSAVPDVIKRTGKPLDRGKMASASVESGFAPADFFSRAGLPQEIGAAAIQEYKRSLSEMTDLVVNKDLSSKEREVLLSENSSSREEALRSILGIKIAKEFQNFRSTSVYFPIAADAALIAAASGNEISRDAVYDLAALMRSVGEAGIDIKIRSNPTPYQSQSAAAAEQALITSAGKILTTRQIDALRKALDNRKTR
jgi:hypothetical protein